MILKFDPVYWLGMWATDRVILLIGWSLFEKKGVEILYEI